MGYIAKFDRISRNHNIPDLAVTGNAPQIAEQIYNYARPRCLSRDIEVCVDLEAGKATIFAGFQTAGTAVLHPDEAGA